MTFISYAQNNEDVLLWRALGHVKDGFYIDVGASDPVEHSVTKAFYDAGWHGINIEPLPSHIAAFDAQRPRDINLAVAAGSSEGSLTLYDVPAVRGWASPEASVAAQHRAEGHEVAEMTVPVRTLAAICAEHVTGDVHFLKIDVEGFEEAVLRGMDFARWRPWILVIEATLPGSRETNHDSWDALVNGQRYRFAWFDGLNRYYVAEEHPELLAHFGIQPNVFDDYISHHLDKAWDANRRADTALRENAEHAAAALRRAEAHTAEALRAAEAHTAEALRAAEDNTRRALEDAQQRANDALRASRERADQAIRALEEQAARVRAELDETQARATALEHDKQAAAADIARLDAALAEAHAAGHAVTEWARGLEQHVVALQASTSWKVTRPLRYAGRIVATVRRPGLLRRVVTRATSNQRLRRLLIPILVRNPALGQRVSTTLQAIKQVPLDELPPEAAAAAAVAAAVPEELKGLPASVRSVLADLQRARKQIGN